MIGLLKMMKASSEVELAQNNKEYNYFKQLEKVQKAADCQKEFTFDSDMLIEYYNLLQTTKDLHSLMAYVFENVKQTDRVENMQADFKDALPLSGYFRKQYLLEIIELATTLI